MGTTTSTTNSQSSTAPWTPQAAGLENAFNQANGALSQAQGAKPPTDYTAQFTPDQMQTFQQMLGYANGTNTQNLNAQGNTNVNNGTSATGAALAGLNGYNPSATNNPQSLVDAANQYVSGQNIPAQVAQAMQQANETARDVTIPGITMAANGTGNADSSRAGIAQGLVQRGLAENAQNMTGALSSQAFQNGLSLAENQANANNTAALSAITNMGNIGNAATNSGTNAITQGINGQGQIFGMGENAGQGEQAAQQANLTNQQQQYQAGVSNPFDALRQYMGIIGTQNWGSNSTGSSTTQTSPSAWSVIGGLLGGLGGGAGLAGNLGWKPFA
jgi:hypothetical protein